MNIPTLSTIPAGTNGVNVHQPGGPNTISGNLSDLASVKNAAGLENAYKGSKVFFKNVGTATAPRYHAQQLISRYGLVTTLSYDQAGLITQVTEPAGRRLKITRDANYLITRVDGIELQR
jgi:YD repeat-containing protein